MALLDNKTAKTARRTFNLRKTYLNTVVPTAEYDNFYDSSTVFFYGKVNLNGDIVYPSERYLSVLPNPNKASGNTYYALNFVAKAFSNFRDYYIKGINAGIVKGDEPNIIEPLKAWQSVHDRYANNIDRLYSTIINGYLQKSPVATIKNFDEFMRSVNEFLMSSGNGAKLSRSSFILSKACPMSISGLAIEITPFISYNNDKKKAQNFYQDPNFGFYMAALKKFGFMADIDYPGRIVADVGSPVMQKYMSEFGVTLDNLFEKYYYKAAEFDYDLIRIYLAQFYNSYVTDYPIRSVVEKVGGVSAQKYSMQTNNFRTNTQTVPTATLKITCDNTLRKVIERTLLTESEFMTEYGASYWLTQYAKTLNYELNNIYDNNKLSKIVKNAQDLNKSVDINSAKRYINNAFKLLRYPVNDLSTSTEQPKSSDVSSVTSPTTYTNGSTSGGTASGGSGGSSGGGGGGY